MPEPRANAAQVIGRAAVRANALISETALSYVLGIMGLRLKETNTEHKIKTLEDIVEKAKAAYKETQKFDIDDPHLVTKDHLFKLGVNDIGEGMQNKATLLDALDDPIEIALQFKELINKHNYILALEFLNKNINSIAVYISLEALTGRSDILYLVKSLCKTQPQGISTLLKLQSSMFLDEDVKSQLWSFTIELLLRDANRVYLMQNYQNKKDRKVTKQNNLIDEIYLELEELRIACEDPNHDIEEIIPKLRKVVEKMMMPHKDVGIAHKEKLFRIKNKANVKLTEYVIRILKQDGLNHDPRDNIKCFAEQNILGDSLTEGAKKTVTEGAKKTVTEGAKKTVTEGAKKTVTERAKKTVRISQKHFTNDDDIRSEVKTGRNKELERFLSNNPTEAREVIKNRDHRKSYEPKSFQDSDCKDSANGWTR
jgi:hypothetical protein